MQRLSSWSLKLRFAEIFVLLPRKVNYWATYVLALFIIGHIYYFNSTSPLTVLVMFVHNTKWSHFHAYAYNLFYFSCDIIRQEAAGALWNLSFDDRNREAIAAAGGVEALVWIYMIPGPSFFFCHPYLAFLEIYVLWCYY